MLTKRLKPFSLMLGAACLAACAGPGGLEGLRRDASSHPSEIAEARGQAAEKSAFMAELVHHALNPTASPYAELQADAEAMAKACDAMEASDKDIHGFLGMLQNPAMQAKDPAALDSQSAALQKQFQLPRELFQRSKRDFEQRIQSQHIGKDDAAGIRRKVADFWERLDKDLGSMEKDASDAQRALAAGRMSGGDPSLISQKQDLWDKLNGMLQPLRLLKQSVATARVELERSLPSSGEIFSGPGMDSGGGPLSDIDAADDQESQAWREFSGLMRQFRQPDGSRVIMP